MLEVTSHMNGLPGLHPFDVKGEATKLAVKWKRWLQSLEIYIMAVNIKDNKRKKAILLHFLGEDGQILYETLKGTEPSDNQYEHAIKCFNDYFMPKKNILFERYNFNSAFQLKNEPIAAYVVRLRTLSKTCEFGRCLTPLLTFVYNSTMNGALLM